MTHGGRRWRGLSSGRAPGRRSTKPTALGAHQAHEGWLGNRRSRKITKDWAGLLARAVMWIAPPDLTRRAHDDARWEGQAIGRGAGSSGGERVPS